MKIPGIVILCFCWASSQNVDIYRVISLFAKQNAASSVVFFSCWNQRDNQLVTKFLSSQGLTTQIIISYNYNYCMDILKSGYYQIAVILDSRCGNYVKIMHSAYEEKYLKALQHWLLLAANDNVFYDLASLKILLDSHVTVAHSDTDQKMVILHEVYRIGQQPLSTTSPQIWKPGLQLPRKHDRRNYRGIPINTAVVVIGDTWENFLDMRYKHLNTQSKCSFILMTDISIILNFTLNLTLTDTWGYPKKGSTYYDGIVGLLECGDIELSCTGLLQKDARLSRIDYAGETFDFGGKFMFLKPSLSEISIIYTLPFKKTVWIAYISAVAILTVIFYMSQRFECKLNPTHEPVLFGDVALISLALICQEGTPRAPDCYSSRICFLNLLMLSLFLTASYSAIIVSLLQKSSNAVNSLKELIESSFTLSMREIAWNTNFVNDSRDPLVKKLYFEKLYKMQYRDAFVTQETGVEKMRSGLYAFYGDAEAYKVISDTYEEDEKCQLKEITINPSNSLALPVRKGSQFKEHITQKILWLREAGMIKREYKRWFIQKPKCDSDSRGFVSVRIKDFYPVLVILSFGIAGSLIFFLLELLHHKTVHGIFYPKYAARPLSHKTPFLH